jgi:hypothetical protein
LETEIRKIAVGTQPGQKVREDPISTNKLGMMMHVCHPIEVGGIGRRILT